MRLVCDLRCSPGQEVFCLRIKFRHRAPTSTGCGLVGVDNYPLERIDIVQRLEGDDHLDS